MRVLVTGGAGYVGTQTVLRLLDAGHEPVVYDNLSTGRRETLPDVPIVVADLADAARLDAAFAAHRVAAVVHLAASVAVEESVAEPLAYYENNVVATLRLLECCRRHGVGRVVYSSSAAVYGAPPGGVCDEADAPRPINPYGATKLIGEWLLRDAAAAGDLAAYVALRYFNVAGADPDGRAGESGPDATHLVKIACQAAVGKRPSVTIFGTDYDTPDGTCVRDYVHVDDIARAHIDALAHLERGGASAVVNCGYGRGASVREVIDCVRRVSGVDFAVAAGPRRAGDPPSLIAATARIGEVLGWAPRHDDLEAIVASALAWERQLT